MAPEGGHLNFFESFSLILESSVFIFENQQVNIILFRQERVFNIVNEVNTSFYIILDNNSWFLIFIFFLIIEQTINFFQPDNTIDDDFIIWDFFCSCGLLNILDWWCLQINLEIVWIDDSVLGWLRVVDCGIVRVRFGFLKLDEEGSDFLRYLSNDVVIMLSQIIVIQIPSWLVSFQTSWLFFILVDSHRLCIVFLDSFLSFHFS